jgi:hypothetical protein
MWSINNLEKPSLSPRLTGGLQYSICIGSETLAKFGNKRADVGSTLGLKMRSLVDVRASAYAPSPTTVFRGKIAIYQLLHEMRQGVGL